MTKFEMRGKGLEEIKEMSTEEFMKIITSRERRALKRGFNEDQKSLIKSIKNNPKGFHRTKSREMVIIPQMLGAKLGIYNGKEYMTVEIRQEMLGHRLGEFALTRKQVKHSAPGFGATRSSKFVPLK